jgi:hypothetical protein
MPDFAYVIPDSYDKQVLIKNFDQAKQSLKKALGSIFSELDLKSIP